MIWPNSRQLGSLQTAELALGILIGVAAGGAGGLLVNAARKRGWVAEGFAGPAVLGLAVCAYASSVALHGNGFIAAFTGGLAFGTTAGRRGEPLLPFVEETGALVSLLVWLAFGAVAVAPAVEVLNWQIVLYAVLSLTVIRMAPVAAVLIGTLLDRATIALVGWFGPRGLASVVFCLLALEEHAPYLARRAGRRAGGGIPGIPERRLIRRTSHMNHPPQGEQSLAR